MAARRRTQPLTNKTCKQMTDLVLDYLNDKLAPTTKRDFQRHLRICPDCVNFLNSYKKTVAVTGSVARFPKRCAIISSLFCANEFIGSDLSVDSYSALYL